MAEAGLVDRLKEARKMGGVSRRELSLLAGCAQAVCSIVERSGSGSVKTLAAFANVLGVSLDWLIAGQKDAKPKSADVQAAVLRARAAREAGHDPGVYASSRGAPNSAPEDAAPSSQRRRPVVRATRATKARGPRARRRAA